MNKEHMTVDFEVKSVKEVDDNYFRIEGYANTFEIDLGDDLTKRGAFVETIADLKKKSTPIAETDYKALMPCLWQHMSNEPVGSFIDMKEDEIGLYVVALLPKSDSFVSGRIIPQVQVGSVRKMSIGYYAIDVSYKEIDARRIRILEKIKLFETSLVTFPMNEGADITSAKEKESNEENGKSLTLENITDVSKTLKEKGFTKNESDDIINFVKRHACKERDEKACKELGNNKTILEELKKTLDVTKKLNEK